MKNIAQSFYNSRYTLALPLIACVFLVGCSPSITDALRPTSTARKLWSTNVESTGARLVVSPDGHTVVAFRPRLSDGANPTLESCVFEASNGDRKDIKIPTGGWAVAFNPDGTKCAIREGSVFTMVQLTTGTVIRVINESTLGTAVIGMDWKSNDVLVVCAPGLETNNYFEMSTTPGRPSDSKYLSSFGEIYIPQSYAYVRCLPGNRVQIDGAIVVDTESDRSYLPPDQFSTQYDTWPEASGSSWYALSGPSVHLYDEAGNEVWNLPLAIDERGEVRDETRTVYLNPRTSRSDKYMAIFLSMDYGDNSDVLVVDLNTGAQLVRIPLGRIENTDDIDFMFDPTDDHQLYIYAIGTISKWRIE